VNTFITIIHIIISISLIALILIQSQGSGLSSAFGGSGGHYHSRRGMEKIVFGLTIFLAVAFFITSLVNFLTY